ncbi:MAG: adenylate/guanylate cyclase domain-containing protein [Bacteroidota bacterium]
MPLSLLAVDIEQIKTDLAAAPDNQEKIQLLITAARDVTAEYPDDAVQFSQDALALAQKLKSRSGVVDAYSNLGLVNMNLRRFTDARTNLNKSISLKKQLVRRTPSYNTSIAKDYRLVAITYENERKLVQAVENYQSGITYARKGRSNEEMAYLYNGLGEAYLKSNDVQAAYQAFQKGIPFARKTRNNKFIRSVEKNLATSNSILQKDLETEKLKMETEAFELESEAFAEEIETIKDSLEDARGTTQMVISEKKLVELERDKKAAEAKALEKELEAQEKANEAQSEKQQKYITGGALGGLLLLLIIITLITRGIRQRRFNKTLKEEKDKSESLLYNILPDTIARSLIQKQKVPPQLYESATIVFTDFKGFTKIAARLNPERLLRELEDIFREFDAIVEKYGLEKIKTIGDAYMAASGLPTVNGDHAIDAVAAALEMQAYIKQRAEKARAGAPLWELRVGLHSGPVIAGVIGDTKFAYDVWGDTVNLASRMETNGEVGEVNISEDTYQLVQRFCECEARGNIAVKNGGSVSMYFVKKLRARRKANAEAKPQRSNWWR